MIKALLIMIIMLLPVYAVAELTRVVLLSYQLGVYEQYPFYTAPLEIAIFWLMYLCMLPFLILLANFKD